MSCSLLTSQTPAPLSRQAWYLGTQGDTGGEGARGATLI